MFYTCKQFEVQLHVLHVRLFLNERNETQRNLFKILFKIVLYQNIISYATILVQNIFAKNIPNAELVQYN